MTKISYQDLDGMQEYFNVWLSSNIFSNRKLEVEKNPVTKKICDALRCFPPHEYVQRLHNYILSDSTSKLKEERDERWMFFKEKVRELGFDETIKSYIQGVDRWYEKLYTIK